MARRDIIEGNPVLVVIDIQENDFATAAGEKAIPAMPGYLDRIAKTRELIDVAHEGALEAMEYLQTGARRTLAEMKEALRHAASRSKPAAAE